MARPDLVGRPARPPSHPFDAVAPRYDAAFTDQELGRWLRAAVWERLGAAFRPGDTVLDLGCGTGADALWLARRGVRVLGIDASAGMLDVAEAKALAAGLDEWVSFARLDLHDLGDLIGRDGAEPSFDGAYSSFGPLNCLPDRRPLGATLGRLIRPGGTLVLVVMGPLCPWEVGWYLAHGHLRTAVRRCRAGVPARVGGLTLRVWYPSPRRLRRELAPDFEHVETVGLGVFLPPSEMGRLVPRAPRLFETLRRIEERTRATFPATWLNDHYVSVFRRRPGSG